MRTALVCLLSFVLSVSVAMAAPAPLPKDREVARSPSVELIKQSLLEKHGITVQSIEPRGNRQWLVVGHVEEATRRGVYVYRTINLVRYQGTDHEGRPVFELAQVIHAHTD